MDSRNSIIGFLAVSAAVLLVMYVANRPGLPAAHASGMTTSGGEYVMTVGRDINNDEDFVFVIDNVALRMMTYRFNPNRRQIEVVQRFELQELRERSGQPAARPTRPGRRP